MVAELRKTDKTLYETDYNYWVLETVKQLQSQNFAALDLENLIEEVKDLSRRDKRKIESLCMKLIEHLLISKYWHSEKARNREHWQREIRNFRKQIIRILEDSPSLRNHLQERFSRCYKDGRELSADHSQLSLSAFPEEPIATLDQLLDEEWLP